ncbi:MAG: flagellar hook-basal body complex protein FliE [Candidatus Midichloria sp.]|uniref:Flagellar hook-basal body protein FliE n=1 Tax=Hyalomma marginatum TaxID=34627 RepID=A0A8S4C2J7_9ACAR|nr:flagellar hook-basal body protein FliE [Hyalomma marginatum]CAG7597621.1 flagellar hook-basal body protein FliE [Hyalomma marginatum]
MSPIGPTSNPVESYLKARKAYQNALETRSKSSAFSTQVKDLHKEETAPVTINISKNIPNSNLSSLQSSFRTTSNNFSFSDIFEKLTKDRIRKIKKAEDQINSAAEGNANAVEVIAAVAESEVALQEIVSIRDKIISAYQEILRMSL